MPREYAKNWFSMWIDEDFCTLDFFDKLFYQVLLGQSGTNDAGICPINFRKWRKALRDGSDMPTEIDLKASLVRLERRRYVFSDEDTGEVLIRSHIRRDQVHKQPAVLVSALRDLSACQSPKFAVVMLAELTRIELPEVKTANKYGERLKASLAQAFPAALSHLETLSGGSTGPFPEPFKDDLSEGFPRPFPSGSGGPSAEPSGGPSARPAETDTSQGGSTGGSSRPPVVVEVGVEVESTAGTHLSNKREKDLLKPDGSSEPADPDTIRNIYPQAFEQFWQHYPRKVSKRNALTAWHKARKRATDEAIIDGAKRYAADPNRTEQFTKHPDGWLNRDGWLDEPIPGPGSTNVDWANL